MLLNTDRRSLQSRNIPVRRFPASIIRPFAILGQRLPKGWGDLLRQFALFLVAYQGYQMVRGLADGKASLAVANGERVIDLERSLGTFFEP